MGNAAQSALSACQFSTEEDRRAAIVEDDDPAVRPPALTGNAPEGRSRGRSSSGSRRGAAAAGDDAAGGGMTAEQRASLGRALAAAAGARQSEGGGPPPQDVPPAARQSSEEDEIQRALRESMRTAEEERRPPPPVEEDEDEQMRAALAASMATHEAEAKARGEDAAPAEQERSAPAASSEAPPPPTTGAGRGAGPPEPAEPPPQLPRQASEEKTQKMKNLAKALQEKAKEKTKPKIYEVTDEEAEQIKAEKMARRDYAQGSSSPSSPSSPSREQKEQAAPSDSGGAAEAARDCSRSEPAANASKERAEACPAPESPESKPQPPPAQNPAADPDRPLSPEELLQRDKERAQREEEKEREEAARKAQEAQEAADARKKKWAADRQAKLAAMEKRMQANSPGDTATEDPPSSPELRQQDPQREAPPISPSPYTPSRPAPANRVERQTTQPLDDPGDKREEKQKKAEQEEQEDAAVASIPLNQALQAAHAARMARQKTQPMQEEDSKEPETATSAVAKEPASATAAAPTSSTSWPQPARSASTTAPSAETSAPKSAVSVEPSFAVPSSPPSAYAPRSTSLSSPPTAAVPLGGRPARPAVPTKDDHPAAAPSPHGQKAPAVKSTADAFRSVSVEGPPVATSPLRSARALLEAARADREQATLLEAARSAREEKERLLAAVAELTPEGPVVVSRAISETSDGSFALPPRSPRQSTAAAGVTRQLSPALSAMASPTTTSLPGSPPRVVQAAAASRAAPAEPLRRRSFGSVVSEPPANEPSFFSRLSAGETPNDTSLSSWVGRPASSVPSGLSASVPSAAMPPSGLPSSARGPQQLSHVSIDSATTSRTRPPGGEALEPSPLSFSLPPSMPDRQSSVATSAATVPPPGHQLLQGGSVDVAAAAAQRSRLHVWGRHPLGPDGGQPDVPLGVTATVTALSSRSPYQDNTRYGASLDIQPGRHLVASGIEPDLLPRPVAGSGREAGDRLHRPVLSGASSSSMHRVASLDSATFQRRPQLQAEGPYLARGRPGEAATAQVTGGLYSSGFQRGMPQHHAASDLAPRSVPGSGIMALK
eukprot:TRINITY_DN47412_c0_g1_i1.p1 TRINITY_DN47412_c0_g1~~TRINITY_DN47412_c0_g1_i1.p1  ORF type:complete len:1065 (+),score=231.40 TRINITY_DN47412_c0_g1_i1:64-3258(+)